MPPPQLEQAAAPTAEYSPPLQSAHALAPDPDDLPATHSVHEAALVFDHVPPSHLVHEPLAASEYVPLSHATHTVIPASGWCSPALQRTQAPLLVAADAVLYCPAAHSVQTGELPTSFLKRPISHAAHCRSDEGPGPWLWCLPGGQSFSGMHTRSLLGDGRRASNSDFVHERWFVHSRS